MPTFRVVILAAVSDPQQVKDAAGEDKESIPYQLRRARETIDARGWTEVAEPLVIPGQTRSINWFHEALEQIGAYRKLRDLVDARTIDLVVCRNYDRLARTSALQQQVSAYLRERGVQIYAIEMPVEPHDPSTWKPRTDSTRLWVEAIAGAQSESYVNALTNFHTFGMQGRVKKGLPPEGIPPYGYHDVVAEDGYGKSKRKRIPDPVEFPIVQRILRMLRDDQTGVYIARWLNGDVDNPGGARAPIPTRRGSIWTPNTVIQLARNPFYGGKVARGRHILWSDGRKRRRKIKDQPDLLVDGIHESAISWEDWTELQEIITARARWVPRLRRRDYLWSGLAVCGYCRDRGEQRSMRRCHDVSTNKDGSCNEYDYLICSRYSYTAGKVCQRNTMTADDFTAAVFGWVQSALANSSIVAQAAMTHTVDPRQEIEADLARVNSALSRLADEERQWDRAYRQKVIGLDKYGDGLQELTQQRQALERERETLSSRLDAATMVDVRVSRRNDALAELAMLSLDASDPDVVRRIHEVLARIEVRGGALTFVAW